MGGPQDGDALAETAVAGSDADARPALGATVTSGTPSATGAAPSPADAPAELGRYHIDGVLGQGAMGVVYAARDPDLDRRVALKVLHSTDSEAARARLLREARAMARLSHPGVVTVHEVGTAAGVDYVAMELIDGGTLGEWLRGTPKPPQHEILAAFEVAGRGLAAAHAAGLVHRDFKPHNVLRSKQGRVVVTDFGLARAALDEAPPPTRPSRPGPSTGLRAGVDAGSLSSTLTATGAVLGTPAYMSPEQHDGGAVGSAADQFAFCVALWEAITGERPFPGQTLGEVRQQIARGPTPASEAKLPRWLRAPLRRGLAVDPAARWPTMDALLGAIHRTPRRVWLYLGAVGVVGAAAVVVVLMRGDAAAVVPGCRATDTELAAYRAARAKSPLVNHPIGARVIGTLDKLADAWVPIQREVCAKRGGTDPEQDRRTSCVRAIPHDLEAALAAAETVDPARLADIDPMMMIGDPEACRAPHPPLRVLIDHPQAAAISAFALQTSAGNTRATVTPPPDPGEASPCLRAVWLVSKLRSNAGGREQVLADIAAAGDAAAHCGDERFVAIVALTTVEASRKTMFRDPLEYRRLDAVIDRAGNDRLLASIRDLMLAGLAAYRENDLEQAIGVASAAADRYLAIGAIGQWADAAAFLAELLRERHGPGDRERAGEMLDRALALVGPHRRIRVQRARYELLFVMGRVDEAHRVATELVEPREPPKDGAGPIRGRVVDAAGAPVAGARVVGAPSVWADATLLAAVLRRDQTATTGPDGRFTIEAAPPGSIVVAEHGARRSQVTPVAADTVVRLGPTGAVFGRVVRQPGQGAIAVAVELAHEKLEVLGPVAADGSFRIEGVPYGKARLLAVTGLGVRRQFSHADVVVGPTPAGPIEIQVGVGVEPITVIVRNQAEGGLSGGFACAIKGAAKPRTLGDAVKLGLIATAQAATLGSDPPAAARGVARPGDAVTSLTPSAAGAITLCALGIAGDLGDQKFGERLNRHALSLELACVPYDTASPERVVLIEVPPMKRLPE